MSDLDFGILGTARIVDRQIPALKHATGCEPVAIASRSESRAQTYGKRFNLEAITGYDRLLARDDIDAVYLPLPNHLHTEWAIKAMESGKHVLVDKPLALSTEEIDRLAEVSEETSCKVMEGFMYRFHPVFDHLWNILDNEVIGEIKHIELEFCHNIAGYLNQQDNYRYYREPGGGALLDLGCYGLDLFQYFLQNNSKRVPANLSASLDVVSSHQQFFDLDQIPWANSPEPPADHTTQASLVSADPEISFQLTVSFLFHRKKFWVGGSDGFIEIDHIASPGPKQIRIEQYSSNEIRVINVGDTDPYRLLFEAFSQSVRTNTPLPISLKESRLTMHLMESIIGP